MNTLISSKKLIPSSLIQALFNKEMNWKQGFLFSLLSVSLSSCFWENSQVSGSPVMVVNEHKLTVKDFSKALSQQLKLLDALAAKDPNHVVRSKENILSQFVVESLTADFAAASGIFVDEKSVLESVNNYRSLYPDDLSFRRILAEEGLSFSEWRERLRYRLLERQVFVKINEKNMDPSETEIQSYYSENKEKFQYKERIQFRQIVVTDEAVMDAVLSQIKAKEFSSLARKYSVTPEEKNGGLVDWIEKGSVDYFDPLFKLREGQISEVFKSPFGFHIAKIEKKARPEMVPLSKVRQRIIAALRADKEQALYKDWLDKQIHQSKVMRNNELIQAINIDTKE
ncbi:MAG: peptidyl-prolyl cis-trans isomerase [Pseudobdellovibrionaceae bacterium]